MPSCAIFAPLRPSTTDIGAGCLACGVCLKDCAVAITASFGIDCGTPQPSCRADTVLHCPEHLGQWAPTAMGHLRTGRSPPARGALVRMRHIHRACASSCWNGTAASSTCSDKMQASVSGTGIKLVYGAA